MKPIQAALAEANMLIDSGSRYVIIHVAPSGMVNMKIGIVNSYGERERIHGAISYYEYMGKLKSVIHQVA